MGRQAGRRIDGVRFGAQQRQHYSGLSLNVAFQSFVLRAFIAATPAVVDGRSGGRVCVIYHCLKRHSDDTAVSCVRECVSPGYVPRAVMSDYSQSKHGMRGIVVVVQTSRLLLDPSRSARSLWWTIVLNYTCLDMLT